MQLSLRQKISVIVCAVTASFLLLMAVSWLLNVEMENQTSVIRYQYIPLVELKYRLDTQFDGIGLGLRDAVLAQDTNTLELTRDLKNKLISELESASQIIDPQQNENLKQAIEDYFSAALDTSKRLIHGETGLSIVDAMTSMQAKRTAAKAALDQVTGFDRQKLSDAFASIALAQERSARTRFWVSISCIVFIFSLSIWIGRGIMISLKEIAKGLTRFGEGDFKQPIQVAGHDELSELARQINKMASQIQSLMHEIESFSYSVAHDLRAPLRSILGFSDALVEDDSQNLSETGKASLKRITSATQRMGAMVDGLLGLSRLNRKTLIRQQTNLTQIANRVIEVLKQNEPDRRITFLIEENVSAWGDPQLLDIVLSNLLGNSWKFTKHQPEAQIQFGSRQENGTTVFFVKDNGAGFDMRYSDKLFGTFQRLHSESEFEGHGIGLATVKSIIEKHGGRIWADSVLNKGTTFFFSLG